LSSHTPTAFITGGTGLVGSHLIELLVTKGFRVRCLIRPTSDTRWLKNLAVDLVHGSLREPDTLVPLLRDVDIIYHVAGVTKAKNERCYFEGNAESTRNLLSAALSSGAPHDRFVLVSSLSAVGPGLDRAPVDESTPFHPITAYGRSKMKAEEYCREAAAKLPVTVIRPPAVYGPRDRDVYAFFKSIKHGLQPVIGSKVVSLIHVRDLAEGIFESSRHPAAIGKTYFITNNEQYDWEFVGTLVARALGKKAIRVRIPIILAYGIGVAAQAASYFSSKPALLNIEKVRDLVQSNWSCSGRRAREDFGFVPKIPIEQGIAETAAWYRKNGWL